MWLTVRIGVIESVLCRKLRGIFKDFSMISLHVSPVNNFSFTPLRMHTVPEMSVTSEKGDLS